MARTKCAILVLLASCVATNAALKVRKVPPADGGQCGKIDAENEDSGGGETCQGKPGEHDVTLSLLDKI